MKYCPNCNRNFEKGNYCPACGRLLEYRNDFDIFGDDLNTEPKRDDTVYDSNFNEVKAIKSGDDNFATNFKENKKNIGKLLSFLSIPLLFVPFYGSIISLISLILNFKHYKNEKGKLSYLIISIVTLVLSIIWLVVVLKLGIINDLLKQ